MKPKHLPVLIFLLFISHTAAAGLGRAPDIDLPGTDGDVHLGNMKGKVVYLDFWASWCLPCKKSFPWMSEIKSRYADQGFEILAVNLDKNRALADEFLKQMQVNFEVVFDAEGESATTYQLRGMPSSYLIGRDGVLRASHVGFRDKDKVELEQAIVDLLSSQQ